MVKKSAFWYPGQGSQSVGMGVSLIEAFDEAADIFTRASDIAGYDMVQLCSEGPADKLARTSYTQPAIFTVEAAITDVLKSKGITPHFAAGHSLGELSAWYAAGVYGFEDGFRLVSERGRLMDGVDPDGIGTMCAVIGLLSEIVDDVCDAIEGIVVVANYNSALQQVISGEREAVEQAGVVLKEKGAKRVLPLKVSGAFHSPLMENAGESFKEYLERVQFYDAEIPVYANVTALPVTKADEIKRLVVQQMTSSVKWTVTVQTMFHDGIELAYETGPGSVLAGLARRIDKNLSVLSVSGASEIGEIV